MKFAAVALFAMLPAGLAHAQGPQCRTASVGASTSNCASEAFVTQGGYTRGPNSSTSGDLPSFSDTSGKVLQDSGVSVASLWVLLNTLTASNSATLSDITDFTATYSDYRLVFENIVCATNNQTLELQVHSNSSFRTSSYLTSTFVVGSGVTAVANPTTFIQLSQSSSTQNSGAGASGFIDVYTAAVTSAPKTWLGAFSHYNGSVQATIQTSGTWNGANTAVDGFQAFCSSGNITSGTIKVYGRQ